jgi:parvulin-like peptidyl-prolyl isomerase
MSRRNWAIAGAFVVVSTGLLAAQQSVQSPRAAQGQPPSTVPAPKTAPKTPPPARDLVAARVNGKSIPEIAVYRMLAQNPSESRKEAIDFLVEQAVVDQYLLAMKVNVGAQEIDAKLKQMKKEAEDEPPGWGKLLESMYLTEEELRVQLESVLRWDEFTKTRATENTLKDFFDKNRTTFDGSQVQARHILISGNAEGCKTKLLTLRKSIEETAAQEVANLPAGTSKLDQEKTRVKALERAFGEAAAKISECPSKEMGGDLGWFPRSGTMVEPFARAAFTLKPYEMSDPVATEFGFHLILATDYRPGREVQFDAVKNVVREVYCDRLRDAVLNTMRPRTQIVIEPAPR